MHFNRGPRLVVLFLTFSARLGFIYFSPTELRNFSRAMHLGEL
jgi:hypothetical protein